LEGSDDCEKNFEDGDDVFLRHQEHQVTKHPRETNGDVDGNVHSEFLFPVSLIGFGGTSKGFVNLTTDEEEENSVRGNDEQSRNEEAKETEQIRLDPALTSVTTDNVTVTESETSYKTEDGWETPREDVVVNL